MPTHILIALFNAKKGVLEERAEHEKKQQKNSGTGAMPGNVSNMMSSAKSSVPRAPSMPKTPSSSSFKIPRG